MGPWPSGYGVRLTKPFLSKKAFTERRGFRLREVPRHPFFPERKRARKESVGEFESGRAHIFYGDKTCSLLFLQGS